MTFKVYPTKLTTFHKQIKIRNEMYTHLNCFSNNFSLDEHKYRVFKPFVKRFNTELNKYVSFAINDAFEITLHTQKKC